MAFDKSNKIKFPKRLPEVVEILRTTNFLIVKENVSQLIRTGLLKKKKKRIWPKLAHVMKLN